MNRVAIFPLTLDELKIINTAADGKNPAQGMVSSGCSVTDIVEIVNDDRRMGVNFKRAVKIKIEKMEMVEKSLHPWFTYWIIVHLETGKPVGLIGFKGLSGGDSAEVGYGIGSGYEGNGYAGEVLKLILRWAESEGNCRKVTATKVVPENIGSQKVLERNGFKEVRRDETGIDYVYDIVVFAKKG